jgi:polyhydroxyalkanoate synthesis repressor PhaR
MAETASAPQAPSPAPVTIKKYANRRLYNTATSSYVTLEHLCQMVKDGVDFVVFDAKTGEDITRQVLTQIIVEEEGKGQNLLPISFMRKLISFYGGNMQWALPTYLDQSMQSFSRNQEQMRDYFSKTMGGIFPFDAFSNMGKQNLAMMEQAMKMFAPFAGQPGAEEPEAAAQSPGGEPPAREINDLRRRLDELEREIAGIGKGAAKT